MKSQAGRWEPSVYTGFDTAEDRFIDLSDFTAFANYWDNKSVYLETQFWEWLSHPYLTVDFDRSGKVDMVDFAILMDNYLDDYSLGQWIVDSVTSSCIDAGNPNSDWMSELWSHGKRINMGAYGGTSEASMSLSSAGNKADFNNDGFVNAEDLDLLIKIWLVDDLLLAENINRTGLVNFSDWAEFAGQWLWEE